MEPYIAGVSGGIQCVHLRRPDQELRSRHHLSAPGHTQGTQIYSLFTNNKWRIFIAISRMFKQI